VFVLPEDAQAPNMLAHDYLRARAPFYPRFDRALFDRYSREFELPADGNLAALSHGQQKKFLLAFGLASQAKLVLLDEPTNGLDVMTTRALRGFLRGLRAEGRCIVLSSHVMQEVAALCDRIVVIANGHVVAEGTPEELRAQTGAANLEDAFVRAIGSDEGLLA
jgi:sodium transport system ATP-binding protein